MDTPNRVEKRSCPSPPPAVFLVQPGRTSSFPFFSLFFSVFLEGDFVPKRKREEEEKEEGDYLNKSPLWGGVHCRRFNSSITFVSGKYHGAHHPSHGYRGGEGVDQHALFSTGKGCLFSFCFTVRSFPGETKRNETPSTWRKIILVRDSVQWTSTPPPPYLLEYNVFVSKFDVSTNCSLEVLFLYISRLLCSWK